MVCKQSNCPEADVLGESPSQYVRTTHESSGFTREAIIQPVMSGSIIPYPYSYSCYHLTTASEMQSPNLPAEIFLSCSAIKSLRNNNMIGVISLAFNLVCYQARRHFTLFGNSYRFHFLDSSAARHDNVNGFLPSRCAQTLGHLLKDYLL